MESYCLLILFLTSTFSVSYQLKQNRITSNTKQEKRNRAVNKLSGVKACEQGSFYNSLDEACWPCDTGMYQDKAGQSACHRCPKGQYQPDLGQTRCITCNGTAVSAVSNRRLLEVRLQSNINKYIYNFVKDNYKELSSNTATEEMIKEYMDKEEAFPRVTHCITKDKKTNKKVIQPKLEYFDSVKVFCYNKQSGKIDKKAALQNKDFPFVQECTKCPTLQAYNKITRRCELCQAGYFYNQGTHECQRCYGGSYSLTPGAQKCFPCPAGTSRKPYDRTLACSKCKVDTYQPEKGRSSCIKCPENSSQPKMGQTRCESGVKACEPGSFYNSYDKSCWLCDTGMYQDKAGQSACHRCPKGQYQPDMGQTSCITCNGTAVSAAYHGRTLQVILKSRIDIITRNLELSSRGTSDEHVKEDMGPRITHCIVKDKNTTKNILIPKLLDFDSVKILCFNKRTTKLDMETALSNEEFPFIQECTRCPNLQAYNKITGRCELCQAGYFYNQGTDECQRCYGGSYSLAPGAHKCMSCPAGTSRKPYDRTLACSKCKVNTYQPEKGRTSCIKCPANSSQSKMGQTRCESGVKACEPGSFYNSYDKSCWLCDTGMYQDKAGQSACHRCPKGQYQPDMGQTRCITCNGTSVSAVSNRRLLEVRLPSYIDKYIYYFVSDNYPELQSSAATEEMIKEYMDKEEAYPRVTHCISKDNKTNKNVILPNLEDFNSVKVFCNNKETNEIDKETALQNKDFPFIQECTKCPNLQAFNKITGRCELCQAGYFYNQGTDECQRCYRGSYSLAPGAHKCMPCPAGTSRKPYDRTLACRKCKVGTYQPEKGRSSCIKCPANSFQPKTGQIKCDSCGSNGFPIMVKVLPDSVKIWLKSFFKFQNNDIYGQSNNYGRDNYSSEMYQVLSAGFTPNDCLMKGIRGWHFKLRDMKAVEVIEVCCSLGCVPREWSMRNSKFYYINRCISHE